MAKKIIVQGGVVAYSNSDPALDLSMNVAGQVNVSKEVNVGNDPLADGSINTEPGQTLHIMAGNSGGFSIDNTGPFTIHNVTWPLGPQNITSGSFLGASALNTLEFYPFVIAFNGSDTLNTSQLNTAYPGAQPGQSVVGPTVVYQCVSSGIWRTLGGGGGGGGGSVIAPLNEIVYGTGSGVTSDSSLTYDSTTDTLTISGSGTALVQSGVGQALEISSDTSTTITGSAFYVNVPDIDNETAEVIIRSGNNLSSFGQGQIMITNALADSASDIYLSAGNDSGTGDGGGDITITAGESTDGNGGQVNISGGNSTNQTGGDIAFIAGSGISGGLAFLAGGNTSSPTDFAGDVIVRGGTNSGDPAFSGSVTLRTNNTNRLQISPSGEFQVEGDAGSIGYVLTSNGTNAAPAWEEAVLSTAPGASTDPGRAGQIAYDANFVYICIATNTWVRAALSTW